MFSVKNKSLAVVSFFQSSFRAKYAGVVCLLLAILSKSLVAWAYTDLEADKSLYLLLSKSFLENGVFAEPVRVIENGNSLLLYNPAILSPLYSLLAAFFIWVTKSYIVAQFIISIIGWWLFFSALAKIADLLFRERGLVNAFVLFSGFFLYPHELASSPKDTLATAFTLWSIFFIHQFLESRPNFRTTLLLGLSFACLCFTKLIYLPAGAVLITLLFAILLRKKNKKYFAYFGLLSGLLLLFGWTVMVMVIRPAQHLAQQHTSLISDGTTFTRGFYPGNLLQTYPFISSSVTNTNFLSVQIEKVAHQPYSKVIEVFRVVDAILLAMLLFLIVFHFRRIFSSRILFMVIAIALTFVGTIIYLSLIYHPFSLRSTGVPWTYVSDARSFLFPMIVLQLVLFSFLLQAQIAPFMRITIFLLFLLEFVHGIYFTAKQITPIKQAGFRRQNTAVKKVTTTVLNLDKRNGNFSLITSDNILRRYAEVKGVRTFAFSNEPADLSWIRKGSKFLIATYLQDSALRNKLPVQDLIPFDTIKPFILHIYQAK